MTCGGTEGYNARHMSEFREQFAGPILAAGLVFWIAGLILSAAATAMVRIVLKAMGYPPKRELLYWLSVTALLFLAFLCAGWFQGQSRLASFEPTIEFVGIGEGEDENNTSVPCVWALVSITNTGEPSVVTGVRLTAKIGGTAVVGKPMSLKQKNTITYKSGATEVIWGDDSLIQKAATKPIPTGDNERGWLLYAFPQLSIENLATIGTVFELTLSDAWNRKYKTTLKYSGLPAPITNIPGIHPRLQEPPEHPVSVQH